MKRLRELFARFLLTKQESLALVAVFGLYAVGFGWRHLQQNALPPPSVFIALADSVANANALVPAPHPRLVAADTVPKPKKTDADSVDTDDSASMETGRLNVNLASERQLTMLPGIGPALAGRIVAHRATVGRFKGPADLLGIKGIGKKTLARFEGMIVFD